MVAPRPACESTTSYAVPGTPVIAPSVSVTVTVVYLTVEVVSVDAPFAVKVFRPIDCDVAEAGNTRLVVEASLKPVVATPVPCCHAAAVAAAVPEAFEEVNARVDASVAVAANVPPPDEVTTAVSSAVVSLIIVVADPLANAEDPRATVAAPESVASPEVTVRLIDSVAFGFVTTPLASLRTTLIGEPLDPPVAICERIVVIVAVAGAPAVSIVTTALLSPAV
jgi:hypothetical protein